jgi:hypothetical protein
MVSILPESGGRIVPVITSVTTPRGIRFRSMKMAALVCSSGEKHNTKQYYTGDATRSMKKSCRTSG